MTQPILSPITEEDVSAIIGELGHDRKTVEITGYDTKSKSGRKIETDVHMSLSGLRGITHYAPDEMVIEAYAGTPLAEIEEALSDKNQELSFEPQNVSIFTTHESKGSIGSVAAMNISGSRRIKAGAARDSLIGVRFVNGRGELIKSGGRVMKNVTGYDLVKLTAGAWGTLGAITHVSFKVQPKSETSTTLLVHHKALHDAVEVVCKALGTPFDVSGSAIKSMGKNWQTALRLEGFSDSVSYRIKELETLLAPAQSQILDADASIDLWAGMNNFSFAADHDLPLWKISVAPTNAISVAESLEYLGGNMTFDWSGGLIWLTLPADCDAEHDALVRDALSHTSGHATLVRGSDNDRTNLQVFHPQTATLQTITQKIKHSFDPDGLINPGKMYRGI